MKRRRHSAKILPNKALLPGAAVELGRWAGMNGANACAAPLASP